MTIFAFASRTVAMFKGMDRALNVIALAINNANHSMLSQLD